jgi:hypothetical protein
LNNRPEIAHSDLAKFLGGRRLANRDLDLRGRDHSCRHQHQARNRRTERFQPAKPPQPGFQSRRQHGGRGGAGLLGWQFGYFAVFLLAALFGAIAVACVLPARSMTMPPLGSKVDDPESQPSGLTMLLAQAAVDTRACAGRRLF